MTHSTGPSGAESDQTLRRQLRESEERFRTLVELTPEPVLVHRMGHILYVNPAAVRAFGAESAEQLARKRTSELIHPDFLAQQTQRMHHIAAHRPIQPMVESRFLRLDGSAFDVEVQGTSIVYDGEPAIHVSLRDISQRKQAQRQLQLVASFFTHSREGIGILDDGFRFIEVNDAFLRMAGYGRDEVLGQNLSSVLALGEGSGLLPAMDRALESEGFWSGESLSQRQGGGVFSAMLSVCAVPDGAGRGRNYMVLVADITAIKEHQRQLERTRILRDMHDGVGSHISAAIRQLQSPTVNHDAVLLTLRDSLDQLKLSIDALNLPPGDVSALLANLRYRLEARFNAMGMTLEWAVSPLPVLPSLGASAMRQLQFIFFAALSNVMQHAEASLLRMEATPMPAQAGSDSPTIRIRVCDNGRGFDPSSVRRKGLVSMEGRAQAIGAQLAVHSQPGSTVVEILLR